jgi:hypothetical protein
MEANFDVQETVKILTPPKLQMCLKSVNISKLKIFKNSTNVLLYFTELPDVQYNGTAVMSIKQDPTLTY